MRGELERGREQLLISINGNKSWNKLWCNNLNEIWFVRGEL